MIRQDRGTVHNAHLIQALRQLLPFEAVLTEPEDLRPFECDGLSVYRHLPMVVVRVTLCNEHDAIELTGGLLSRPLPVDGACY